MNVKINAKEALHNNKIGLVLTHRQGISPKQLIGIIMNFKNQLKRELKRKGAACLFMEAFAVVGLVAMCYMSLVLIGSMQS